MTAHSDMFPCSLLLLMTVVGSVDEERLPAGGIDRRKLPPTPEGWQMPEWMNDRPTSVNYVFSSKEFGFRNRINVDVWYRFANARTLAMANASGSSVGYEVERKALRDRFAADRKYRTMLTTTADSGMVLEVFARIDPHHRASAVELEGIAPYPLPMELYAIFHQPKTDEWGELQFTASSPGLHLNVVDEETYVKQFIADHEQSSRQSLPFAQRPAEDQQLLLEKARESWRTNRKRCEMLARAYREGRLLCQQLLLLAIEAQGMKKPDLAEHPLFPAGGRRQKPAAEQEVRK